MSPSPSPPRFTPREMLARLVAFPTVSRDSNLPLVDWVEDYCTAWGAECRRTWNDDGTKANLLATLGPTSSGPASPAPASARDPGDPRDPGGRGGSGGPGWTPGGVVLSGHTDVVPVDGQPWSTDPFTLVERDGRLFGRGTADMKGFLAVVLALVPEFAGAGLRRPLHLALSYDEEVGCLGVGRMVDDLVARYPRPGVAWVGEPTSMQVVGAHKAVNAFRTRVKGRPAHSSQPHRGAGAIFGAARLMEGLRSLGEERRRQGEEEGVAGAGAGFEPPWTTVQVGTVEGGTALNILPAECTFVWEYRSLPGEDPSEILEGMEALAREEVLPGLREFAPEAEIVTETLARVPPLRAEPTGPAEALLRSLPGVRAGGAGVVSFATEGGSFQAAGISTAVCGPGSIDQAHRPDEFIEASELDACARALRGLLSYLTERG